MFFQEKCFGMVTATEYGGLQKSADDSSMLICVLLCELNSQHLFNFSLCFVRLAWASSGSPPNKSYTLVYKM